MIWANPPDVILYARSSYYYNNMCIIYLFSNIIQILSIVLVFDPENCGKFAFTFHFLTLRHHVFRLRFHA